MSVSRAVKGTHLMCMSTSEQLFGRQTYPSSSSSSSSVVSDPSGHPNRDPPLRSVHVPGPLALPHTHTNARTGGDKGVRRGQEQSQLLAQKNRRTHSGLLPQERVCVCVRVCLRAHGGRDRALSPPSLSNPGSPQI